MMKLILLCIVVIFYAAIFGFVLLWVFWAPSMFSLFVMCISFLFFGVFMGTIYKRNSKVISPL